MFDDSFEVFVLLSFVFLKKTLASSTPCFLDVLLFLHLPFRNEHGIRKACLDPPKVGSLLELLKATSKQKHNIVFKRWVTQKQNRQANKQNKQTKKKGWVLESTLLQPPGSKTSSEGLGSLEIL